MRQNKTQKFFAWLLVIIVAVGLLGSSTFISLFTNTAELSTREIALT